MGSLAPFLPPHQVRRLAPSGPPPRLPHVERFPAALLFSDISGFTALTERLQARGREGVEEIAGAVNAAFAPAIRAIERQGGSIVSFGGDALFAVFPGASPVRRAHIAAEVIREAFAARGEIATSAGSARLGISQAIHHGEVVGLHLGAGERRHYLVTGPAVRALARLEARASGGKLVLSSEARRRLLRERTTPQPRPPAARARAAVLRPYLDPRLQPLLRRFEGEYRRVAVLFLETRGDRPAALQTVCLALVEALDRTEGVLLKTDLSASGTKWICVFGIPLAHEEDPDRAARAALELVGRAPRGLSVRGGLHAGVVANILVGTSSRRSFDVMGDVVNTAARAMTLARWGEVLVTEESRKLLAGVETTPRGARAVKGKAAALEVHALSVARSIVKQIRVSAPMIGRDRELATIVGALERARVGQGCVIGVTGDPGIGKSRLKYEAAKVARSMGFETHEGRAISFGGMAYWTIGGLLKDALGLPDVPGRDEVLAKVSDAGERLGMKLVDRHHLADVLGVRHPDASIEQLQPKDLHLNTMIAIRAFLQALAREKPRLLVLEDMHWADGASRESAQWLAAASSEASWVVLLLYRSGYETPKGTNEIVLRELSEASVDELLRAHLGVASTEVAKVIREGTGGNPFYVEELTKHLLEIGILAFSDEGYRFLRDPRPDDVPGTIEAVIAARLDRLPKPVRRAAQHGAVIGRTFFFELLARLPTVGMDAGAAVRELCARELIFEKAKEPHLEYIFKHALTRDVAYGSILATRRCRVHRAVADAIATLFAREREAFLPMLGHHRKEALQTAQARECYLEGARLATRRHALEEAERLFRSYLDLVKEPSEESIGVRNELGLGVLKVRGRMSAAEMEHRRAMEEARARGAHALEAESLRGLAGVCAFTGRIEEARALHVRALAIARTVGDRRLEGLHLSGLAGLHLDQDRLNEAQALYEEALAIHREAGDRTSEGYTLGNLAIVEYTRGRRAEAQDLYRRALAMHREVGNIGPQANVLLNIAIVEHDQGRFEKAQALYDEALSIAREVGSRRSEGHVLGHLANLRYQQGRFDEGQAFFQQAVRIAREIGDRQLEGRALGNLASLLGRKDAIADAIECHHQALAIHRELGDRRYEGRQLGSLGDTHLNLGRLEEARAFYERALVIAAEVGDRRAEGRARSYLCVVDTLMGGADLESHAALGEVALCSVDDRPALIRLLCRHGHGLLASGKSAAELLGRASRLGEITEAGADSDVKGELARLASAQTIFDARGSLVCGYRLDYLTPGQLRWLHEHRPGALPPEVMARLNDDGTLRPEESPSSAQPTEPAAEL